MLKAMESWSKRELDRLQSKLTYISCIPITGEGMEIRKQFVSCSPEAAALIVRLFCAPATEAPMELKCKAANALGSLFMCKEAGQNIMNQYGSEILSAVEACVSSDSFWAQGDAAFVLSWIVRLDSIDQDRVFGFIPSLVANFGLHVPRRDRKPQMKVLEKQANCRVYDLVCLLNLVRRNRERVLTTYSDLFLSFLDAVAQTLEYCHQHQHQQKFIREHMTEIVPLMTQFILCLCSEESSQLFWKKAANDAEIPVLITKAYQSLHLDDRTTATTALHELFSLK